MAERKAIPKSVRFEVFKRDSFTCQYCGSKSPDVVLHVDHIKAVAAGGENDIMNLVTACVACNSGKGARALDDSTVLEKQRAQLEELNERREQLEMMIQWREGLNDLNKIAEGAVNGRVSDLTGYSLNDRGLQDARKLIRQHGLSDVLEAIDVAFDQYGKLDDDGKMTSESWNVAWNKVGPIINGKKRMAEKPYLKDLFYVRGILRNRVYVNEGYVMQMLERAHLAGFDLEAMKQSAKTCRNWTQFQDEMHDFISENETE